MFLESGGSGAGQGRALRLHSLLQAHQSQCREAPTAKYQASIKCITYSLVLYVQEVVTHLYSSLLCKMGHYTSWTDVRQIFRQTVIITLPLVLHLVFINTYNNL